jgi:soluble lytic murein transglycosylase-like protein
MYVATTTLYKLLRRLLPAILGVFICTQARANQSEEALSFSVLTAMRGHMSAPFGAVPTRARIAASEWVAQALRMVQKLPSDQRRPFLEMVHYEATRAALDPWLVLSLIKIESGYGRYATSPVGAQGYMQIMPFWKKSIGQSTQSLYDPAVNIRYGCTILRHYLMRERGDVVRALARYNGSLGKTSYPDLIFSAWKQYRPQAYSQYQP